MGTDIFCFFCVRKKLLDRVLLSCARVLLSARIHKEQTFHSRLCCETMRLSLCPGFLSFFIILDQVCNGSATCIEWSEWSDCSLTCGGGTATRSVAGDLSISYINGVATVNGCMSYDDYEAGLTTSCNTEACWSDCVGSWTSWSCPATCGSYLTGYRTFSVQQSAEGGAADCDYNSGTVQTKLGSCAKQDCPVDCVGTWSGWSTCSETCGQGEIQRTFHITTDATHGGSTCGNTDGTVQQSTCELETCSCSGNYWNEWGACSETCGSGTRTLDACDYGSPVHLEEACEGPCGKNQNTDTTPAVTNTDLMDLLSSPAGIAGSVGAVVFIIVVVVIAVVVHKKYKARATVARTTGYIRAD